MPTNQAKRKPQGWTVAIYFWWRMWHTTAFQFEVAYCVYHTGPQKPPAPKTVPGRNCDLWSRKMYCRPYCINLGNFLDQSYIEKKHFIEKYISIGNILALAGCQLFSWLSRPANPPSFGVSIESHICLMKMCQYEWEKSKIFAPWHCAQKLYIYMGEQLFHMPVNQAPRPTGAPRTAHARTPGDLVSTTLVDTGSPAVWEWAVHGAPA